MSTHVVLYWHLDEDPSYSIQNIITVTDWPDGMEPSATARGREIILPKGMARGHSGEYLAQILAVSSKFPFLKITNIKMRYLRNSLQRVRAASASKFNPSVDSNKVC